MSNDELTHVFGSHTINILACVHLCMHLRHEVRRSKLIIDSKADESPVTKADREAEAAMRRLLAERVPEHAIFGANPLRLLCMRGVTPSYKPAGRLGFTQATGIPPDR